MSNVIVSIPVSFMVDIMVSWIGPFAPILVLVEQFGPIRDSINSTMAAIGIENVSTLKVHRISCTI